MADAVTISVEARDPAKNKGTGSRVSRKLRAQGKIPAIVYGHKQANQPITISRDDVWQMIKRSSHLARLSINGVTEMVLVRDVQWDHLGKEIIHLDFARVSADETVTTEIKLELHGTAPGVSEGGVLDFLVHTLEVTCLATSIPDSLRVELSDLHLDKAIHVKDLVLPQGVTTAVDPELTIAHVTTPRTNVEPTATEGGTEPEVIGRKAEDKEEK